MGHTRWISCLLGTLLTASLACGGGKAVSAAGQGDSIKTPDKAAVWLAELDARAGDTAGQKDSGKAPSMKPSVESSEEAERISVDFYKIDLHNVFRLLGQVSHKNIVVDENVKGSLTLALQDVPWTFVLDVVKNLKELDSMERNDTIMIYPRDKKVAWGAEAGAPTGSLNLRPAPVPSRKELQIEKAQESKTPIESMIKAEAMVEKAQASERQGDFATALEHYKEASGLWPDNVTILKKVATIALGKAGDELTALNAARKALTADPNDTESAALAAVALARMGKTGEAKAYFDRAMSGENIPQETLYNYAVFTFSQGEYRETLRVAGRYEALHPLTPELMLLKAQSYEHLNNIDLAVTEYRSVARGGAAIGEDMKNFAQARIQALAGETAKQPQ